MTWPYIILSYLSLLALGLSDNIRGPLFAEILNQFQLSDSLGSWMFATSSSFAMIGSYASHLLVQKIDRVRNLQLALILMSCGLFGMGQAAQFSILLVSSSVFGLSIGLMGLSQNVLATIGASPQRRQQVLSGLHAMYGLASLMSPILVASLTGGTGNWRTPFFVAAVIPLFVLLYSVWKCRSEIPGVGGFGEEQDLSKKTLAWWPQIWVGAVLAAYVVAEIMVSSRLALFLRREKSMDLEQSSFYVTLFFILLLFGRLLYTFVRVPLSIRLQLVASLIFSIVFIVLGIQVHEYFFIFTGFSMAPFYPLAVTLIYQIFPRHMNSAISISMTLQSFLVVVMHLAVGALADVIGIGKALYVGPLFLFISLVALLTFDKFFPKPEPE